MASQTGDLEQSGQRGSPCAVVVASEPLLQRGIVETLRPTVVVVELAGNAADANKALSQHWPDLLLLVLDPPMRDCDPEHACGALIRDHPRTRTLVLMREAQAHQVRLACRAGARGVLPTDVDPATIPSVLAQIVAGETVIHPPFMAHLLADAPAHPNLRAARGLTRNQIRALTLVAQGRTSKEIAVVLRTSITAVDHTIERASQRLGAAHRAHAVAEAIRRGLLT